MNKTLIYTYLGTNGTLTTPIHLPDVYCIKQYQLIADTKKKLTKDGVNLFNAITIDINDIDNWFEIDY